jgi:predicted PurR-regulated permease PerM
MRGAPFLNLVLAVALAIMLGWILMAGRGLILPVIAAAICVYIMTETARIMGEVPVLRRLPSSLRLATLLLLFTVVILALGLVVGSTVDDFLAAVPRYQANLETMLGRLSDQFGRDLPPTWDEAADLLFGAVDLQTVFLYLLGWVTRFGLTAFLILVYAGFIMAEWMTFETKLGRAFPDPDQAEHLGRVIRSINQRIGRYLVLKTFVNVILGTVCYVILRVFDVDFPLFWAIIIGFSNYIPYVGSIIGVAFPVILSLAQFDSFFDTVILGLWLTAAQIATGNFLDPWLMGRHLNLSRVVIIIALAFWATLWGIPGAILAIPMTSMMMIVLSQFPETRFLAVMISETGEPDGPLGAGARRAGVEPRA